MSALLDRRGGKYRLAMTVLDPPPEAGAIKLADLTNEK
jgi:hypothetical protein